MLPHRWNVVDDEPDENRIGRRRFAYQRKRLAADEENAFRSIPLSSIGVSANRR